MANAEIRVTGRRGKSFLDWHPCHFAFLLKPARPKHCVARIENGVLVVTGGCDAEIANNTLTASGICHAAIGYDILYIMGG